MAWVKAEVLVLVLGIPVVVGWDNEWVVESDSDGDESEALDMPSAVRGAVNKDPVAAGAQSSWACGTAADDPCPDGWGET